MLTLSAVSKGGVKVEFDVLETETGFQIVTKDLKKIVEVFLYYDGQIEVTSDLAECPYCSNVDD
jgi:hypothetical protein